MADNTDYAPKLGLLINPFIRDDYFHIHVRPVAVDIARGEANFTKSSRIYSSKVFRGIDIEGLEISSQGDSRGGERRGLYAFNVRYHDRYFVERADANRMAKSLNTIERKLAKIAEARGYARSFAEYAGRVAEVLRADAFLLRKNDTTDGDFRVLAAGEGINRIAHFEYLWRTGKDEVWKADAA